MQRLAWQQFSVELPAEAEPLVSSGNHRKGRVVFADLESTLEIAWKSSRPKSGVIRASTQWDDQNEIAHGVVQLQERTFVVGVRGPRQVAESRLESLLDSLKDQSNCPTSEWEFLQLRFKTPTPCDAVRWERKAGHTHLELLTKGHMVVATCSALWTLESEFSDFRSYFDAYAASMGRKLDWTNPNRPRTYPGVPASPKSPGLIGATHEGWVHTLHFWYGGLWRKEPELDLDFLF